MSLEKWYLAQLPPGLLYLPLKIFIKPKLDREKPTQEKLKSEIASLNEQITKFSDFVRTVCEGISVDHKKQLEGLQQEKKLKEKKQTRKIIEAKSAQNSRLKNAKDAEDFRKDHPDVAGKLSKLEMRAGVPARRPIEEEQPELHNAIMFIVTPDAGAYERRRTEVFNTVRTLESVTINTSGERVQFE